MSIPLDRIQTQRANGTWGKIGPRQRTTEYLLMSKRAQELRRAGPAHRLSLKVDDLDSCLT